MTTVSSTMDRPHAKPLSGFRPSMVRPEWIQTNTWPMMLDSQSSTGQLLCVSVRLLIPGRRTDILGLSRWPPGLRVLHVLRIAVTIFGNHCGTAPPGRGDGVESARVERVTASYTPDPQPQPVKGSMHSQSLESIRAT